MHLKLGKSSRGVTWARREIIEKILREQPEYTEYFAQVDAEETAKAEKEKVKSASAETH